MASLGNRAALGISAMSLLLACSGGGPTAPKIQPIATISISASTNTIKAGKTVQFAAQGKDAAGNPLADRSFVWTSSNNTVATIAADGTMTALTAGSTTISAASEGKTADFPVVVSRASIATIVLTMSPSQLNPGQSVQATAAVTDSTGKPVTDASLNWTTTDLAVARVDGLGFVTAVGPGTARVDARGEGILGSTNVSVTAVPVSTVTVALTPSSLLVGQSGQASAVTKDSQGNVLSGRTITWNSSDTTVASVSAAGVFAAKKGGAVTISATSEGRSGGAVLTVAAAQACSGSQLLSLALGEIRTLTSAQKSFFCLSGAAASEYVVIPFNNSTVAASTVGLQVSGLNTSSAAAISADLRATPSLASSQNTLDATRSGEMAFRRREFNDLKSAIASPRRTASRSSSELTPSFITGIPATPAVDAVFPINVNLTGNTCSDPKLLHGARVVAVFAHVVVLVDTLAPTGGYTSSEIAAFGQAFETTGYGLDTLNFGAPSDIDANGKVIVLFTPGVNAIPGPPGGVVLGLQAGRDVFPVATCLGSNEGEMFYLPVPDPNKTINANYTNKTGLSNSIQSVLVHEFQHLINIGRRVWINNAQVNEESWLNEALSHIAEELLYYQVSGNAPRSNIGLATVQSTQSQLDAINFYQIQNLGRLKSYMVAPETNSPYASNDNLETRGASWQLLRYAADRKGGVERTIWRTLVNSTTSGQSNFNAVFGDLITQTRDWAVAQYADDIGLGVAANYTNPSWNFRTLLPAINSGAFPLLTRTLATSPIDISLVGGAASYVRFQIGGGTPATLTMTSSGQPLPSAVDVIVMRTK